MAESETGEQGFDAGRIGFESGEGPREGEVFRDGQAPDEMGGLEDDAHVLAAGQVTFRRGKGTEGVAVEVDVSSRWRPHAGNQVQQGGLARSGGAEQEKLLAAPHVEVRKGQFRPVVRIAVSQSLRPEHGR